MIKTSLRELEELDNLYNVTSLTKMSFDEYQEWSKTHYVQQIAYSCGMYGTTGKLFMVIDKEGMEPHGLAVAIGQSMYYV